VLVVLVMMLHLRSAALVSVLLPAAVSVAFVAMWSAGVTANVVSLAGIAIAIGTMVDLGIVDADELQRYREWQRQANPDCEHCLADRYQLEMALHE
jgi:Cu(I)/Ag(I) efflux system membrane protein CusA/SilA